MMTARISYQLVKPSNVLRLFDLIDRKWVNLKINKGYKTCTVLKMVQTVVEAEGNQ